MGSSEIQVPSTPPAAIEALARSNCAATARAVCSLGPPSRARLNTGSRMREDPHVRFCERLGVKLPWATHRLVHCRTEQEAEAIKAELRVRLEACGLQMHPTKTQIVYC